MPFLELIMELKREIKNPEWIEEILKLNDNEEAALQPLDKTNDTNNST